jgi:hypothetical protein
MEFLIDNFENFKFNLTLMTNIQNYKILSELDKSDNIVLLNPDYIISAYQIKLSIYKALYNFEVLKKHKSEKLKKEIIYFSTDKGKVDMCTKLHKINESNPNCYLIFINQNKEEVDIIKKDLQGEEIMVENYCKFVNYENIMKEFDIKEEEVENDNGIMGAVYNRIAIKDLK